MGLPDESKFTFETLCERWSRKYGYCTTTKILDYVNSRRLKMKTEYPAIFEYDPKTGKNEFIEECVEQYFTLDEVLRFEAEHSQSGATPEPATGEMHPKEKETLLKLVAVMASTGYGYDPTQKKSPIPSQIQKDADLLDISFDVDTVRKWLKKASEFLPPKEDHSES